MVLCVSMNENSRMRVYMLFVDLNVFLWIYYLFMQYVYGLEYHSMYWIQILHATGYGLEYHTTEFPCNTFLMSDI